MCSISMVPYRYEATAQQTFSVFFSDHNGRNSSISLRCVYTPQRALCHPMGHCGTCQTGQENIKISDMLDFSTGHIAVLWLRHTTRPVCCSQRSYSGPKLEICWWGRNFAKIVLNLYSLSQALHQEIVDRLQCSASYSPLSFHTFYFALQQADKGLGLMFKALV